MIIRDKEVDKEFVYFLMAYYFHWTPEQVDKLEYTLVESLLIMLHHWIKRINEVK